MKRPSTLLRGGWALSLAVCLSSAGAAGLPTLQEAEPLLSSASRVMHASLHLDRPCTTHTIGEAIGLIFDRGAPEQVQSLAEQCDQQARLHGHAEQRLISVRIQALLAMHHRDLDTLHQAGHALIRQKVRPEYVPDGHMCLAFACLASGDTPCAREHLTQARAQFTALQIPQALEQLIPLEQALLSMEAADAVP